MERSFYNHIEGFRGMAVLLVLVSHWLVIEYFPNFIFLKLGFLGVNFFFVLSGFLITEILLIEKNSNVSNSKIIKNFFAKRTLRIFPIYYLTILLLALFNVRQSISLLPFSLTYSLNIASNWFSVTDNRLFMHLWSLCVEEQFYLIWPFLLLLTLKKDYFKTIISIVVLSVLFKSIIYLLQVNNYNNINHSDLIASMDALALGGLLAYFKCCKKAIWERINEIPQYIILLLLLLFWVLSFYSEVLPLIGTVFLRLFSALIGGIIIVKAVKEEDNFTNNFLGYQPLKFLGRISYGIYLYHWIISSLLGDFFNEIWQSIPFDLFGPFSILKYHKYVGSFSSFLIVTSIVATISFYFIERPILKLKRYF